MKNQTKKKLNDQNIRNLFKNKNFVFLSTLMEDGSPQVSPTWVEIENDDILINTAIGRTKHRNVTRDPRVGISIIDMNNPYHSVVIRGKVIEQLTGDIAEKHIDKLSKKYLNQAYPYRGPGEKRVILKIRPHSIFHMNQ